MREMKKMKFDNNVKYFCMMRDLFQFLSVELVNKFGNNNNYMIEIKNSKIKEIFNKARMDYYQIENLIQDIAQKLFEEGKYYLNIVITNNENGEVKDINFYTKTPETIAENQKKYRVKFKNSINILNFFKRKWLLCEFSKMNEYQIQNYMSSNELTYFSEKANADKCKFFKITKNMYMQGDTPEEITTYYHNYRVIKTRIWQVKYVKHILKQLNRILEEIFHEKDIIKYNGISMAELNKYMEKLKENEISMIELSTKIMKVEAI